MLGYSKMPLTKSEIWITSILLLFVSFFFLSWLVYGELSDMAVFNLLFLIVALVVSFLFPKIFYHINIDFGNIITSFLWLILVAVLYLISGTNIILRLPLFLYLYLHFMRVLHFVMTEQVPTYKAHWSTVKSLDKQAKRRVSDDDVGFAVLHALIPVIILVVQIWWEEVYG